MSLSILCPDDAILLDVVNDLLTNWTPPDAAGLLTVDRVREIWLKRVMITAQVCGRTNWKPEWQAWQDLQSFPQAFFSKRQKWCLAESCIQVQLLLNWIISKALVSCLKKLNVKKLFEQPLTECKIKTLHNRLHFPVHDPSVEMHDFHWLWNLSKGHIPLILWKIAWDCQCLILIIWNWWQVTWRSDNWKCLDCDL